MKYIANVAFVNMDKYSTMKDSKTEIEVCSRKFIKKQHHVKRSSTFISLSSEIFFFARKKVHVATYFSYLFDP
jgi:hypothetical protein